MAYNDFDVNFKPTESPLEDTRKRFNDLNAGFTSFLQGQETAPQIQTRYNEQFGIPQMQQGLQQGQEQYDYLGNQIRGVPKDIAQGSQESILTQGQTNRMTQARQAPLLEQQGVLGQNLSQLGNRLSTAQSNVSQMVNAEQAQQVKMTQPWLKQYDTENVLSSMAMTGWTQNNSMELQRLLSNQQAGITLSEGEKNRANQLAMQEKEFENALKMQKSQPQQPNYITAGAGTSIFDPSTGKFIGTAPYKPTGGGTAYTPSFGSSTSSSKPTAGFKPLYGPYLN